MWCVASVGLKAVKQCCPNSSSKRRQGCGYKAVQQQQKGTANSSKVEG